jgi:hypothetical protein
LYIVHWLKRRKAMTEDDINRLKASIYFDLAEMLRRSDSSMLGIPLAEQGSADRSIAELRYELRSWAINGGKDPDEEEM